MKTKYCYFVSNYSGLIVTYLILIGTITLFYWFKSFSLNLYIETLSLIFLSLNALVNYFILKYQVEHNRRIMIDHYLSLTRSSINDIDKLFINNPLLNRLYYQMYINHPSIQKMKQINPNIESVDMKTNLENGLTPAKNSQQLVEMIKVEHQMANIIFQKIADVYFSEILHHDNPNDVAEWIHTFKQWMKSPILREHWKYLKYEQHPIVQHFVDTVLL